MSKEVINKIMPMIPLRGVVLFPGMNLHFDVGRKSSLAALRHASEHGGQIFFAAQYDMSVEEPKPEELFPVGVIGIVRQVVRLPEQKDALRVVVEGTVRATVLEYKQRLPFFMVETQELENKFTMPAEAKDVDELMYCMTAVSGVKKCFQSYFEGSEAVPVDLMATVEKEKDPVAVCDLIAAELPVSLEDKCTLLCEPNVYERLFQLRMILCREIEISILDRLIEKKVQAQMDENQREYYLREELKAVTEELEKLDGADATGLLQKITQSAMPQENKDKLLTELERLKRLQPSSPDYNVLFAYIEKVLDIPWGSFTKENKSLEKAQKVLERDHFGLKDVKKRVTEMIAAMMISPELKGQIICLAGPPGVGKTSIAKSIAKATGRNYVRVSLGGVKDEAEIRGHRRTYLGSMPGRIVAALIQAKSMNPLILLDEVDKLGGDYKGDPASALLEVLDAEQNFSFADHYIDLPVDLSRVLFLTTANDIAAIPDPLRDRMEIIEIPGYTRQEKFYIAKKHLLPKQLKLHALTKEQIKISDAALKAVIDGYTKEAGVRLLERRIAALCRKESVRLAGGNEERLEVTDKNLPEFLGVVKYRPEEEKRLPEVGLVNGLAWTSVGGELLEVEVAVMEGTGKLELTGSLGDVMKESAHAAVSFIRTKAEKYGISPTFYKDKDIHIHFPEGAVPKDGPSAGITVTVALISALTGRRVRSDVAMTGEITLRGRVLAIGGLREKSMAAYREGMKYVLIPKANVPDLEEVDDAVKEKIQFIPVYEADTAVEFALLP